MPRRSPRSNRGDRVVPQRDNEDPKSVDMSKLISMVNVSLMKRRRDDGDIGYHTMVMVELGSWRREDDFVRRGDCVTQQKINYLHTYDSARQK